MVFHLFSGGPVTQARQPVAVWSNHACQVAFPWLQNSLSGGSVLPRLQKCLSGGSMNYPWLQEMHPTAKNDHDVKVESTNRLSRHFKGHQRCPCPVGLAVTGFGRGMHPYPRDKMRVRGSCWTFIFTEDPSSSQCSRIAHSET